MPKIVNRHDAPHPFLDYASKSHYNKGDADYSVTTLIDSPQIASLNDNFPPQDEEIDPFESRTLWSLVGTAIHHILEQCPEDPGTDGVILKKEQRITTEHRGYKLTGGIDLQTITGSNVVIGDYKFTTVYSAGSSETAEKWEQQLNLYRWLVERETDLRVTGLQIYAILRDWKPSMVGKIHGYPDAPGQTIELPVWGVARTCEYVDERLSRHIDAKTIIETRTDEGEFFGTNQGCSDTERWWKPGRFRVIKEGGSRAVSGGANLTFYAARKKLSDMGEGYEIDIVEPERYKRCEGNYCGVAQHCSQWSVVNESQPVPF